ncbi:hypothetical protein RND59_04530 [Vibrio ruber]|uniref:hypothetical protein n=1 Tax=Vibrio ruber TaxID=184755 RepID=UPI0028935652|nr:hypothetical protein [Vibrio ruber]WNJ96369.1 hypothetical protein RND59_04530 [Vibrio ruber]
MIKSITHIKENIFNREFMGNNIRYMSKEWIEDSNKVVFILDGGTDLFADERMFERLFSIYPGEFYVAPVPDECWNIDESCCTKVEFDSYTDYFNVVIGLNGVFYSDHLICHWKKVK